MSDRVDILIVDDRPEGLVAVEAVLTDPRYNLVKASSGPEALAKVLEYDFAVILMDVQMPGMDGFETARLIKQREKSKDIPIIFLTAINKSYEFITSGYSVGAVDYILKPFDPQILKSKVAVFVELFLKSRKLREQAEIVRELQDRERARIIAHLETEGRRRYQNLADAVPLIVWRTSKDGNIEYCNQYLLSYSGMNRTECLQRGFRWILHPEDIASWDEKWAAALEAPAGFEMEARLREKFQDYRWHLIRVTPEYDSMSNISSWIGTATDIHDQKAIQENLLRAKEAADQASEAKTRFLANMSHEIRTPLGVLLGFVDLLVNNNLPSEKRKEYGAIIQRSGGQLSKIIDEILDISKVEAGKVNIETSDVDLVDLINDVQSMMAVTAEEKGLELRFEIARPLPQRIQTDPLRFRQILINIVGNGIKFTNQGSVKAVFTMEYKLNRNMLKVRVTDSGPGLTKEQVANLFQPFTQGDNSISRRYGGTGLGLAISRKFAQALGGDIRVEKSVPGEGSTFAIELDAGKVSSEMVDSLGGAPARSIDNGPVSDHSLRGYRVLLIDDSPDNQELIRHLLEMEEADVDVADNGEEGVKKALNGRHHVVLMDIQMPGYDGYMATRHLRERGYRKPIIALTAHAMNEEREKCLRVGCDEHLTKPIDRKKLVEQVVRFGMLSESA